MPTALVSLAQAAGELPDLTLGQMLTALSVMSAFGGSLLVYSIWAARWHRGQPVVAAVARKPHYVPPLLLMLGVFLMGLMILSSLMVGQEQAARMVELSRGDDKGQTDASGGAGDAVSVAAGEDPTDADPAGQPPAAETEPEPAAETRLGDAQSASTANAGAPAAGDQTAGDQMDGQVGVEEAGEVAPDDANPTDDGADQKERDPRQQLLGMMFDLLTFDLVLFLLFGGALFVARRTSPPLTSLTDICWDEFDTAHGESPAANAPVTEPLLSDMMPADVATADVATADAVLPGDAVAAASQSSAASSTEFATPEDTDSSIARNGSPSAESTVLPPERWQAATEIRVAFEAFLVAYLPTVLLRGALITQQEDPQKHPLLEVLENGLDVPIMALVFSLAVVAAPIVEELVFRVVICGGLIQRRLWWTGLIGSSVMFSLSHGYPDSVALLPLAITLCFVYARRRSYRTVILVHFFFNLFNMGIALLQQIGN